MSARKRPTLAELRPVIREWALVAWGGRQAGVRPRTRLAVLTVGDSGFTLNRSREPGSMRPQSFEGSILYRWASEPSFGAVARVKRGLQPLGKRCAWCVGWFIPEDDPRRQAFCSPMCRQRLEAWSKGQPAVTKL